MPLLQGAQSPQHLQLGQLEHVGHDLHRKRIPRHRGHVEQLTIRVGEPLQPPGEEVGHLLRDGHIGKIARHPPPVVGLDQGPARLQQLDHLDRLRLRQK